MAYVDRAEVERRAAEELARDLRKKDFEKYGLKLDKTGLRELVDALESLDVGQDAFQVETMRVGKWAVKLAVKETGLNGETEYCIVDIHRREIEVDPGAPVGKAAKGAF